MYNFNHKLTSVSSWKYPDMPVKLTASWRDTCNWQPHREVGWQLAVANSSTYSFPFFKLRWNRNWVNCVFWIAFWRQSLIPADDWRFRFSELATVTRQLAAKFTDILASSVSIFLAFFTLLWNFTYLHTGTRGKDSKSSNSRPAHFKDCMFTYQFSCFSLYFSPIMKRQCSLDQYLSDPREFD